MPERRPFATVAEGLGWLYAIERASLLHELVRHHISDRIPGIENACAYLSAYHGVAADRWAELGEAIDLVAISPVVVETMTQAAIAGFECAHEWFQPLQLRLMTSR